ncbi:hypothetical protein M885DRAFT_307799 [Pelagophyceae sp. CCMP2097]|nr:hypothetical protein M885DRAFT_307799 [Pelagophyceae sp. CCMP2097]
MLPRWLRLGLWLRCLAGSNPEREGLVSWLAPRVESKCRLSLRPDGYTLFFFPTNRVFESQADFDNALHGRVALCKTAQPAKTRDITKAPKNRIGLVTFATSMAYLRSNGTHRFDDKWKALLEREKYAERHGYAHYVWLGNLDGPATAWCSEKTASNALGHAVKTLALLAVLETGDVDAVLYADVDSTPTRPQFNVEQYLALSDEADLFMSSQAGKPIVRGSTRASSERGARVALGVGWCRAAALATKEPGAVRHGARPES